MIMEDGDEDTATFSQSTSALNQGMQEESGSDNPKPLGILLKSILLISAAMVVTLAGVSVLFLVVFMLIGFSSQGYKTDGNPFMVVSASLLNIVLCMAVFVEIVTARWWYFATENQNLARLNTAKGVVYICVVIVAACMCAALDICFVSAWVSGQPESGSVVNYTFAVIVSVLWLMLVLLRGFITVNFKRDNNYQLLNSNGSSLVLCSARCAAMTLLCTLLFAALVVFLFLNAIFRTHYALQYKRPGKLVNLKSGPSLHLHCKGEKQANQVTIVLETGLPSVASMSWYRIFPMLAESRRTCYYDRGGYGWSYTSEFPRKGDIIASELYDLLTTSGEVGNGTKILLAGQSWGGQLVRIFQAKYPSFVAAVALIDSPGENSTRIESEIKEISYNKLVQQKKKSQRYVFIAAMMEALGLTRIVNKYGAYYTSYYDSVRGGCKLMCPSGVGASSMFNNRWTLSVFSEQYHATDTEEILQILTKENTLANVPLAVFTAGANVNGTCDMAGGRILLEMGLIKNYAAFCDEHAKEISVWGPIHYDTQERLSQLSQDSVWKIYWESRHMIQWDYPEELAKDLLDLAAHAEELQKSTL